MALVQFCLQVKIGLVSWPTLIATRAAFTSNVPKSNQKHNPLAHVCATRPVRKIVILRHQSVEKTDASSRLRLHQSVPL